MKVDWNNGGKSKLAVSLLALDVLIMAYLISKGAWLLWLIIFSFMLFKLDSFYRRDRLPKDVLEAQEEIVKKWEET